MSLQAHSPRAYAHAHAHAPPTHTTPSRMNAISHGGRTTQQAMDAAGPAAGTADELRQIKAENEHRKVAACLVCRRSKVKCERGPVGDRCRRCIQLSTECERPAFHVGRRKGVKK